MNLPISVSLGVDLSKFSAQLIQVEKGIIQIKMPKLEVHAVEANTNEAVYNLKAGLLLSEEEKARLLNDAISAHKEKTKERVIGNPEHIEDAKRNAERIIYKIISPHIDNKTVDFTS